MGLKKLSICIPSFNRAAFLPDLLQSILSQYDPRVEVVVCDNGSQDETEALMAKWQEAYSWIVYERLEKNIGPDLCIVKSIEKASGEYCWLMGDDDIIERQGLSTVLKALEEEFPDITGMTVNRRAYDFSLQTSWMEKGVLTRKKDQLFLEATSCFEELFPLFGFLSSQVVKRDLWRQAVNQEGEKLFLKCNAYLLIYLIGRMIQQDPYWLYLHTPCVGWRSGNDSFAKQLGVYGRFTLDVIGYEEVAASLFTKDSLLYRKSLNQVCSSHLLAHIRALKWKGFMKGLYIKTIVLCFSRLKNSCFFWTLLLPTLLAPVWFLKGLRFVYHRWQLLDGEGKS